MKETKPIHVKPEEVSIDTNGKIVINNPDLAMAIQETLVERTKKGPQTDPVHRFLDYSCSANISCKNER